MDCGDEKLSKYLTQTFTAHCNAMICQQVTLLGDAEWPKVADAVIEAHSRTYQLLRGICGDWIIDCALCQGYNVSVVMAPRER